MGCKGVGKVVQSNIQGIEDHIGLTSLRHRYPGDILVVVVVDDGKGQTWRLTNG